MPVSVFVLATNSPSPIAFWDTNPNFIRKTGSTPTPAVFWKETKPNSTHRAESAPTPSVYWNEIDPELKKWSKLHRTLFHRSKNQLTNPCSNTNPEQYLVFLCFHKDTIKNNFPLSYYQRLIWCAQNYAWGAKVIMVISQEACRFGDTSEEQKQYLHNWLRRIFPVQQENQENPLTQDELKELYEGYLTPISGEEQIHYFYADDLIELPEESFELLNKNEEHKFSEILYLVYLESIERVKQLKNVFHKDWNLWIPQDSRMEDFFPPEVKNLGKHLGHGEVQLITIAHIDQQTPIWLTPRKQEIGLVILCNKGQFNSNLDTKYEFWNKGKKLIQTRGPLESVFLCMHIQKQIQPEKKRIGKIEHVEPVEIIKPNQLPPFTAKSEQNEPFLLISSSFDATDDQRYLINASIQVARIKRMLPFGFNVQIHPALNGEELEKLISHSHLKSKSLTVWVYIGHGEKGKLQAAGPVREPTLYWLDRFTGYQKELPLVIFCACYSAEIAHQFAASGVGVAIGFKNQIVAEHYQVMCEEIVPVAIRSNGDPLAIIEAYHRACLLLRKVKVAGYPDYDPGPVAFLQR